MTTLSPTPGTAPGSGARRARPVAAWLCFGVLLGLLVLVAACGPPDGPSGAGKAPAAPAAPNVVLVTIDTLRADHVGAYGAPQAHTPTLDGLAARGVRFETAIADAPITLPSHASILTGVHPHRTGVRHNGIYRLGPEADTLAERLSDAGYSTGAVVGAFVLARRFGLAQGFDHYDDAARGQRSGASGFLERPATDVTDAALAWTANVTSPFLLWVHYYDPHAAYRPPQPWAERFADRPYDGEIAYVDHELGRLLDGLRARGQLEHAVVAVTADHGESLGEHDEPDHSYSLYDAVLRVPLLVAGAGVPRGTVVADVVRTVDLAPTLLGLLGLPPLPDADGRDLRAVWRGEGSAPPPAYAETLATRIDMGWAPLFALRTPEHLYVRAPRPELYDVRADPGQTENLLESAPETARPVAAELEAQLDAVLAGARPDTPERLDADTHARLVALGYALPAPGEAPAASPAAPPTSLAALEPVDPKDGRRLLAVLDAALAAYAADDMARARALAEQVVKESPGATRAHRLLGVIALHTGEPREAVRHLSRAVALAPRSAELHAALGDARRAAGDAEGALAEYEAAVKLDPDEPTGRLGLMWGALRRGDRAGAEEHARRVAENAGPDALLWVRLGDTWAAAGDHVRAGAAYEQAVRHDASMAYAQMRLATELARFGKLDAAERHRTAAGGLATDPRLATAYAMACAQGGDPVRARSILEEILARAPEHPLVRRALAQLDALAAPPAAPAEGASR